MLRMLLGTLATTSFVFGQTGVNESDIQTVYERRLPYIVSSSLSTLESVRTNISSLRDDGTWPDVDYATGCDAQRASWPAGLGHWDRIVPMAAAYHGGVEGAEQYVKNPELRTALSKAMEYWFANDFSTIGNGACIDAGGKDDDLCPCGTPGLWNTNWYSNVILVPTRVGKTCLLLRDELTPTELGNCTLITARAYAPFFRDPQPGYVAGANTIEMASTGIAGAILENNRTGNASRLFDAYQRVHNESTIQPKDRVDGIKPDGSFLQHIGIIYDGNYGKDFSNAMLELELQAVGTAFEANETVKDAFAKHINGAQWMVFVDKAAKVLHWDYSVVGRMIAFALVDDQATANIKMNLTSVQKLGDAWNSTHLQNFAGDLNKTFKSANAGNLNGNRMFWNSDYMVHRADKTVTTLKLLSNRTQTSECVNSQNPLGFHLSDGAMYQYTTGAEYIDMYGTLDWDLVPGTTTDYGATSFNCSNLDQFGIETYAGGVSAGDVGVAAMRYVNPLTRGFSFRKAWFFFKDNVQHVLINGVSSTTPAPVFSVLDQRLHNGSVYLDGERVASGNYCDVGSLWHAGTGYVFPESQETDIWIEASNKTGNWTTIGTSSLGNTTKDMFVASIAHDSGDLGAPLEYSIFPATKSYHAFEEKADSCTPKTIMNDGTVSAALDSKGRILGAAFWNVGGGSVRVAKMGLTISVDRPVVLVLKLTGKGNHKGKVYIADPNHATGTVHVRIVWFVKGQHPTRDGRRMLGHARSGYGAHSCEHGHDTAKEVTLEYELPQDGMTGSGLVKTFEK